MPEHKQHKKHESRRGRSGLSKDEMERLEKHSSSSLIKDAEKAFDDTARAKTAASKNEWDNAEMDERNAADEESFVEREAKKKYTKKQAAKATKQEVEATRKLQSVIRHEMEGGAVLAGGALAGGEVLAGGQLAGGEVLAGGQLEGGLAGGELEGGAVKAEARAEVGKAKTEAKKTEYDALKEVAKVRVGHSKRTREHRSRSREMRRSESPKKKHHSKSPKKHHKKEEGSPKKHHSKSPKKHHKKEEGSPKRQLPRALVKWQEARKEYFKGEKQRGVIAKGTTEYEGVDRIYKRLMKE